MVEARRADAAAYRAIGTLYNALMTALVLGLVTRRGEDTARDYVFRHFRRQHLEKFLPGLQKLGLAGEKDAPACALYHYHSNALGGVKTGYLRESDRKAWVRYPPPRWIWKGTAIAAVPHAVSAAMLHGWHGHNGVSLGNPGLGFVCTGMTVDGMPGLEGYYFDYGRPLEEGERVRFAYGTEEMPRVDWSDQPKLETASWPEERRLKTFRAYAIEYLRTMLPTLQELLGPDDARRELDPARFKMFKTEGDHALGLQRAEIGNDPHETLGQHFEQMLVKKRADLDREPRLLQHLADQCRAMIFARIRPAARQIPFIALVQEQQDAAIVDQHALHRHRVGSANGQ